MPNGINRPVTLHTVILFVVLVTLVSRLAARRPSRGRSLSRMLDWLEAICRQRGLKLHYMSAREAYNVVKAAEQGLAGNPEEYRDFRIPKTCNMLFHTKVPVAIDSVTPGAVHVRQIG